jgi:hypothetical protein
VGTKLTICPLSAGPTGGLVKTKEFIPNTGEKFEGSGFFGKEFELGGEERGLTPSRGFDAAEGRKELDLLN